MRTLYNSLFTQSLARRLLLNHIAVTGLVVIFTLFGSVIGYYYWGHRDSIASSTGLTAGTMSTYFSNQMWALVGADPNPDPTLMKYGPKKELMEETAEHTFTAAMMINSKLCMCYEIYSPEYPDSPFPALLDQQYDLSGEEAKPSDQYDFAAILDINGIVIATTDGRVAHLGSSGEDLPGFNSLYLQKPEGEELKRLKKMGSEYPRDGQNSAISFENFFGSRYSMVGDDAIGQDWIWILRHSMMFAPGPFLMQPDFVPWESDVMIGSVYVRSADEAYSLPGSNIVGLRNLSIAFLGVLVIAVLVTVLPTVLISYGLSNSLVRRVQAIRQGSQSIAQGDLDSRIDVSGNDEIASLAQQFNIMANQLSTQIGELRSLSDHNALLAQESEALATLEERRRLARELHDSIKQRIFALGLNLSTLRSSLPDAPKETIKHIENIEQMVQDSHQELDAVIQSLRPARLQSIGLGLALKNLLRDWNENTGINVNQRIDETLELELNIEHTLFRVTEEALSNITKHSQAKNVSLELSESNRTVTLVIVDDGIGFDIRAPRLARSFGLVSMEERVKELGGKLTIESQKEQGATIMVVIHIGEQ